MRKWSAFESGLRLLYWHASWYELLIMCLLYVGVCVSWLYIEELVYLAPSLAMVFVLGNICGRYAQDLMLAFGTVPNHRKRIFVLLFSPILLVALPAAASAWYFNGFEISLIYLGVQVALYVLSLSMALGIPLLRVIASVTFVGLMLELASGNMTQIFSWQRGILALVICILFLFWVSRSIRFVESVPDGVSGRKDQKTRLWFSSSSSESTVSFRAHLFESGSWPKILLPFLWGPLFLVSAFLVWFFWLRDLDTDSWSNTLRSFGSTFIEPSIGARIQTILLISCMSFWAVLAIPRLQTSLLYPFSRQARARSTFMASLLLSLGYFLGIILTFLLLFVGTQGLGFEVDRLVKFALPVLQVTVVMVVVLPVVQCFAVVRHGKVSAASAYGFLAVFFMLGLVVFGLELGTLGFAKFLGYSAVLGLVSHLIYWQALHRYFHRADLIDR